MYNSIKGQVNNTRGLSRYYIECGPIYSISYTFADQIFSKILVYLLWLNDIKSIGVHNCYEITMQACAIKGFTSLQNYTNG